MKCLRVRIKDSSLLLIIERFLKAGYFEAGQIVATEQGTPQGGNLTPQTILQKFRFCFRLPCREPGFCQSMARALGGSQIARRIIA